MPDQIPPEIADRLRREEAARGITITSVRSTYNLCHPEILDEAFAFIGKDIVLAHAKDLDHDGDAGHQAAGQGKLD